MSKKRVNIALDEDIHTKAKVIAVLTNKTFVFVTTGSGGIGYKIMIWWALEVFLASEPLSCQDFVNLTCLGR